MKKRDFYLPSSDGKSRLHCVEWMPEPVGRVANSPERADLPEGKPDPAVQKSRAEIKLWVQLVHGMNEHMGRYGEFAAFLAEHGIAVIGHDCLGHGSTAAYGATELSKEDRGFFAAENGGAFLPGTPCPRTVTGFCRCFAFRIGKIRGHNGIIRNFQFRKFLPAKSNRKVPQESSTFVE